jgi:aquaporin Z
MNISLSIRHFMAETYGTFVVVFLGTLTYVMLASFDPILALLLSAVAYGGSYIAMHYTLAHISGAHFNPLLTIAARDQGRLTSQQAINFILAQVAGAFTAALMILLITQAIPTLEYQVLGFRELSPFQTSAVIALIVEMFIAFFVVYVYLAVSKRRHASWTGLSTGVMTAVMMMATGLLTGGHANPARSIATLLFLGPEGREQIAAYIVATVVGAMLASLFYKHLKYEDRHDVA